LETIDVNAQGVLKSNTGIFNYLGFDIQTKDVLLKLDNTKITINDMSVKYKNIINGTTDIFYDAHTKQGLVKIKADSMNIQNKLLLEKEPLNITYAINNGHDTIALDKSMWKYLNTSIKFDALNMPYQFDT